MGGENGAVKDWDDEFANSAYIEGAEAYPDRWALKAQAFRDKMVDAERAELDVVYGDTPREKFDLFLPKDGPKGLTVFVHGGYWMAFDKSYWSHLACGAAESGWAMCLPSYTLAPDASLGEMTVQIARAISVAAASVGGPICLSGHSAGGHLVTRMVCRGASLDKDIQTRIKRVVSISGLHDLRNLRHTKMNEMLKLSEQDAIAESAALQDPIESADVTCWVGGDERPEFVYQAKALNEAWGSSKVNLHVENGRHHFDIIDDLAKPNSVLCAVLTGAPRSDYS